MAKVNWRNLFKLQIFMTFVRNIPVLQFNLGLLSTLAYLRGTISTANVWTGQFCFAGLDSQCGNFTLSLSSNLNSYSGTLTEITTSNLVLSTFSSSGTRTSSAVPVDSDCFRADSSVILGSSNPSFTGLYSSPLPWAIYDNGQAILSSYNVTGGSFNASGYEFGYKR